MFVGLVATLDTTESVPLLGSHCHPSPELEPRDGRLKVVKLPVWAAALNNLKDCPAANVPPMLLTVSAPPYCTEVIPETLSQASVPALISMVTLHALDSQRALLIVNVPMDGPGDKVPPARTLTGAEMVPTPARVAPL